MTDEHFSAYVEDILDYIMKKCLWQFHSRAWDRQRQNAGVMEMTKKILLGEDPARVLPEERCYFADAVMLARGLKEYYPWISTLELDDIGLVLTAAKSKLDTLTIHGSLNEELNDPKY
jgi:nitrogenase delta subunit